MGLQNLIWTTSYFSKSFNKINLFIDSEKETDSYFLNAFECLFL